MFSVLCFLVMVMLFSTVAKAATCNGYCNLDYYGTNTPNLLILWANSTTKDHDFLTLEIGGSGVGTVFYYDKNSNVIGSKNLTTSTNISLPSNVKGFKLTADSGEFHTVSATSNNPLSSNNRFEVPDPPPDPEDPPDDPNPTDPPPDDGGSGGDDGSGGSDCDSCTLFECPSGRSTWAKLTRY
ncbi:hypothetical protein KHA80_06450 [Anaerobacillus sp. HL2]|nr:hypothetical protein KHA80_06450 [Anaerobacillus sp. HL2]